MNRGKAYKIGVVLVVILAFILFLAIIYPALLLAAEQKSVLKQLDNPYINDNFSGWKEVELDSSARISVPQVWNVEPDGESIVIICDGDIIAQGLRYGPTSTVNHEDAVNAENNLNNFLVRMASFPISDIKYEYLTVLHLGNGADYLKATYYGTSGEEETHYQLQISAGYLYKYYFDFGNVSKTTDARFQQIVAMAYSYQMGDG